MFRQSKDWIVTSSCRAIRAIGITAVASLAVLPHLSITASAEETVLTSAVGEYDFSRWELPFKAKGQVSLADHDQGDAASQDNKLMGQVLSRGLKQDQVFSFDLNDLFITPTEDQRLSSSAQMMSDGSYQFAPSMGFMGGIDTGTVLFYSAGAVIGLVGSNLKLDESKPLASGNTSFLEDPANFQTAEFNNQYGLQNINAHYAYARGHNGDGVLVSVMDTPFNTSHANLDGAFVDGYNPADGSTDVALDCNNASNPCRHGTHVAGIIAGRKTDSATSMHGVAYKAQVKPVAFLNSAITLGSQQVEAFKQASGIDNATGKQIVAMNNSWGPAAGFHSQTYNGKYFKLPSDASISSSSSVYLGSRAAAEADTIMVFAAGNDGWNSETGEIYLYDSTSSASPSAIALASSIVADDSISVTSANRVDSTTAMPVNAPDTSPFVIDEDENEHMWLVVVATDDNNTITTFSNGCSVTKNFCLAAPGKLINSTNGLNSSPYVELNGTSMAAPHVTGAIAILADMYPNLIDAPENISQILLETATDLGAPGIDDVYGHGLLNLQKATGPLGTINISDSSVSGNGAIYGDGATIETPIAFGDALARQNVQIGGMDKYDRVFMLNLPVQNIDMTSASMVSKSHQGIKAPSRGYEQYQKGLSLTGGSDGDDNVVNAGLQYGMMTNQGEMLASLTMNMTPQKPQVGTDAEVGYSRYFKAMAYAGETQERMQINMRSPAHKPGAKMSSLIKLDRGDDQSMTILSETTAQRMMGNFIGRITLGGITEEGRMLGGEMTGALQVHSTHTIFAKTGLKLGMGKWGQLDGYYEIGKSTPSFMHQSLVSAKGITSDTYGMSYEVKPRQGEELFLTIRRPVAITGGTLSFNTITGYNEDGDYQNGTLNYSLAPKKRETEMLAEYRRQFFPGNLMAFGFNHQVNAQNIAGLKNTGGYMRSEWQF